MILIKSLSDFNSIKVQLELILIFAPSSKIRYFNSIKVQLELLSGLILMKRLRYFNSIKVQLEPDFKKMLNDF